MGAFDCFDEIRCIHQANLSDVRRRMEARFLKLGIAGRVRHFTAVVTPGNPAVSQVMSHRQLIEEAHAAGHRSVLVFEHDVLFLERSCEVMEAAAVELESTEWRLCCLGGAPWYGELRAAPGLTHWQISDQFSCAHAVAYHARVFEKILAEIPGDFDSVRHWLESALNFERYLSTLGETVILHPRIASLPALLPYEDPATHASFTI